MSYVFGARYLCLKDFVLLNKVIWKAPYSIIEVHYSCSYFTEFKNNPLECIQLKDIIQNTIPDWTPPGINREYFLRDNRWLWRNGMPAFNTIKDAWNAFSPWYYYRFPDWEFVLLETKNWGRKHIHTYEFHTENIEWWEYNMFTKMYQIDRELMLCNREENNLSKMLNSCIWENDNDKG
jgi:hypothetical protein